MESSKYIKSIQIAFVVICAITIITSAGYYYVINSSIDETVDMKSATTSVSTSSVVVSAPKVGDADPCPQKDGDRFDVKPGEGVFYKDVNGTKLKDADPATFTVLCLNFAKDKNYVYYGNELIQGADLNSFVALNEFYGKDSHAVYQGSIHPNFGTTLIKKIQDADPSTFVLVDHYYAKDKSSVYHLIVTEYNYLVKLDKADPETFAIFPLFPSFAKDKNNIYFKGDRIEGVSTSTFEPFYYDLAKDGTNVYNGSKVLEGANPKTFMALNETHSIWKDDRAVYQEMTVESGSWWKKIEGADPETFTIIKDDKYSGVAVAKDNKCIYSYGRKVLDQNGVCKDPSLCTKESLDMCK